MKQKLDEIRNALEHVANDFGEPARSTILFENGRKHVREIGRILASLPEEGTLLDVGGGLGVNVLTIRRMRPAAELLLADRFVEYDETNRMGSKAVAMALLERAGIRTLVIDFWPELALPVDSGTVDVATSFDVIEHLPGSALQHLREIRRTLRSTGTAIVGSPNAASLMKRVRQLLGEHPYIDFDLWLSEPYFQHYREYTIAEHRQLLERAGFAVDAVLAATQ